MQDIFFGTEILSIRSEQYFFDIIGIPVEALILVAAFITVIIAILSFRASQRANELTTVPKLIVKYIRDGKYIALQNLDPTKLAYAIKIRPLYLWHDGEAAIYKVVFKQNGENYCLGKEHIRLDEYVLKNGGIVKEEPTTKFSFAELVPILKSNKNRAMVILFTDSQGVKYFTIVSFDNGKERILRAPTKLSLVWKIRLYYREQKRVYKLKKMLRKAAARDFPEHLVNDDAQ